MTKKDFLLSVIVPVYNEEKSIDLLMDKLLPILASYNFELIFVNDGSKDKTIEKIGNHAKKTKQVKVVSLQRNFGHQMALTAGYDLAKGDAVVSIDADLQDPPELIHDMITKWKEGFKVVYAKRAQRNESWFKRTSAKWFYDSINLLSETPIPKNVGDYRLIDRKVVDMMKLMPEQARFLRGLVAWGGFPTAEIQFTRNERLAGETHYPLKKMFALAFDGIMSFSTKPLRIATYFGFISAALGGIGIFYAITLRFLFTHEYWVTGWTALFVAIMFFGGIQLITIGIIGEYIGKIYKQVQQRPLYLVDETINL